MGVMAEMVCIHQHLFDFIEKIETEIDFYYEQEGMLFSKLQFT